MKSVRYIFILVFLLSVCRISWAVQPPNLTSLLNELLHRRDVKIAFSHVVTDPVIVKDSISTGDTPVVLARWLAGTDLAYKELDGGYYIYKKYGPPTRNPRPASRPVPVPVPEIPPAPVYTAAYPPVLTVPVQLAPQLHFPYARLLPLWTPAPSGISGPSSLPVAKWAVKTNLLYDATSTLNLGVEFGLGHRWTLDISGNYNPWTFSGNRKMKHWLVQPEVRWWSCTRFSGHFVGLHAHGGGYNWGGMLPWAIRPGSDLRDYRYQGWLVGAGVSYGYHWVLGNRWGLEATVGAGYAYLDYDMYPCAKCGRKIGGETQHYFGPTKAGITLIFMVK